MKNIQTLILIMLALSGCKVTDHLNISNKIPLTKENITSFSGQYSDFPDTLVGTSRAYDGPLKKLSLCCAISKTGAASRKNDGDYIVQLSFKSDRQLIVTLLFRGQLMDQFTIHGKIKDGYFYRRKYFAIAPFVPIFFGYTFGQSRIKMTADGLTVDNKSKYWWFMLVAGGSRTLNCSATYKRL